LRRARAQEDETILIGGLSGHAWMRFIDLDPAGTDQVPGDEKFKAVA
jgi:hypothetical protein